MARTDCNVDFGGYFEEKTFDDISSEQWREYIFPKGVMVRIEQPQWLNVSSTGGHRIIDIKGRSHYIPYKWVHLYWEVFQGEFNFVR